MMKSDIWHTKPFEAIASLARQEEQDLFLVGGFLRDRVLRRQNVSADLDFCLQEGALGFAHKVARKLKAAFVILDKERGCGRVVYKEKATGRDWTFDFIDFRGGDLKEDLSKRDFTINTMALKVPFRRVEVIDHFGARRDLAKKEIRMVSDASFDEDPLRILRAFSLAATFGFKIAMTTRRAIVRQKDALKGVAGERLRDELFKILAVKDAWRTIARMDQYGVLEAVVPQVSVMHHVKQGAYHHLDVWGHSLETVKKLEKLMEQLNDKEELVSYLNEKISADRSRAQLLKLAALLHDIGKPKAFEVKAGKTMFHGHERIGRIISDAVSERLKLSTKERFALDTIIFWHLRPGYLADNRVLTKRAVFRYFRDTKEEALSVLLVSIADQRATRGPMANRKSRLKHEKISFSLIEEYFLRRRQKPFSRLIGGADLIKSFQLEPGPVFSVVLTQVEEAQVEGSIKTKTEALRLAKKIILEEGRTKSED